MGRVPEGAVALSFHFNTSRPIAGQTILKKKAFAHVKPDRTRANHVAPDGRQETWPNGHLFGLGGIVKAIRQENASQGL